MSTKTCDSTDRIVVTQSDYNGAGESIVIDDIYDKIQKENYKKYYKYFTSASYESETFLPLYDILWPHLIYSPKGGLVISLLLFDKLDQLITEKTPNIIIASDLNRRAYVVLLDVAEEHGIEVEYKGSEPTSRKKSSIIIYDVGYALGFIFKQIIYCFVEFGSSSHPESPVQVFPFPNRFDSLSPVINNSECHMDIVCTHGQMSTPNPEETDVYSSNSSNIVDFMDMTNHVVIFRQLIFLIQLVMSILIGSELTSNIRLGMNRKNNQDISHIINESYRQAMRNNPINICKGIIAGGLFTEEVIKKAVLGGIAPRDRAIMIEADKRDINLYYVPHTIEQSLEQLPPRESTMFVSGPMAKKHIQASYSESVLPKLVPMGRPYLQEKYKNNDHNKTNLSSGDELSIVVLTQGNDNSIRTEFLFESIRCSQKIASAEEFDSIQIIIKIHPSESKEFYNTLLDNTEYDSSLSISIREDQLYKHLSESDLALTINSNAGLESMMLGTPCISINFNEPITMTYPYLEYGDVPVLKTKSDVDLFCTNISADRINMMATQQLHFARNEYMLNSDGGKNISAYILGTSRMSRNFQRQ